MKNKQALIFIVVNIIVAFLGFVRSFAFMKFFDFTELGTITMVSTAASFIGLFQLGLINGGYRLIALGENNSDNKVNNVIFSYFGCLFCMLIGISLLIKLLGYYDDLLVISVSLIMGLCMLVTNWLTNSLIGALEYRKLNLANGISAFASILCLILAYLFGLYGALMSLLIQPLLFVILVFLLYRKAVPKRFILDFSYIRYILSFGFIPFLSGIFVLLHMQIERWSIITFLGEEQLGRLYIVFLLVTLWSLIPASINSLYFPRSISSAKDGVNSNLLAIIRQYFFVILSYCMVGGIGVILLIDPIVSYIFPAHVGSVIFVYTIVPGLIFKILGDPITLLLNSIVKLKPIFHSDLISIIIYIVMVIMLVAYKNFTLQNILYCYVIYNFVRFIYLLVVYMLISPKKLIAT
ncbi:hypothetical protein [Flavobacterium suzhouense]|uniref:O-antigen/teichoic acid export membrane protein n=1 Tax=Flavobacterium suzhouense TaxID=1529638 RepID=A0ABW5NT19_9FLAO